AKRKQQKMLLRRSMNQNRLVKVTTLNPVDLTTPSLPAARPEENAALFREFLRWQETSAQRDTPTVRPNAAATREAPPRRKRKARRRHTDDDNSYPPSDAATACASGTTSWS